MNVTSTVDVGGFTVTATITETGDGRPRFTVTDPAGEHVARHWSPNTVAAVLAEHMTDPGYPQLVQLVGNLGASVRAAFDAEFANF